MKLKEFNSENTITYRSGVPRVNCYKTGMIVLNKYAYELLGLNGTPSVVFLQDEEDETQWYVEVVKDKGFKLKNLSGTSGGYGFSSAALVKNIKTSTECDRFLIAGKPTELKNRKIYGLLLNTKV